MRAGGLTEPGQLLGKQRHHRIWRDIPRPKARSSNDHQSIDGGQLATGGACPLIHVLEQMPVQGLQMVQVELAAPGARWVLD